MQKLIKLNDQHYIVVDDSEIKEGDFVYHSEVSQEYTIVNLLKEGDEKYSKGKHIAQGVYRHKPTKNEWYKKERKITHSTQPLEKHPDLDYPFFHNIDSLSLSEVEEAINGYSVEEFAWNNPILSRKDVYDLFHKVFKDRRLDGAFSLSASKQIYQFETELREISKIKAHQELVKDKLFTVEDIEQAMIEGLTIEQFWEKCCKLLLPKTEWKCYFDEQGKIKLI